MRLATSLELLDFATGGIDIGVRYGRGRWAGLESEKLMDEEVYPVCSPAFLSEHRRALRKPRDVAAQKLIHDLSVDGRAGFATWDVWFKAVGVDDVDTKRGLRINNSASVLQAAIDGHGVALARSIMAQDDIAAGRLVRLLPEVSFAAALAYYIVYRPECGAAPKVVAFKEWLVAEAAKKETKRK